MPEHFTIPVTPMGAPRQTQRDKWKKRPVVERYHAFRDVVRLTCNTKQYQLGEQVDVEFHLPIPKSRKDLLSGEVHQEKPDLDNLLKAFMDCWEQDKGVHTINAKKLWTDDKTGFIKVYINR
jgi:Holliday junction resolvase RusA-like endonuclease